MKGQIRIGTSNVVVPGNKSTFPTDFHLKSRLHYYSTLFNTVEINRSFYKTPLFSTYEKWSRDTLPGFQFSIKLSKEVTHAKELQSNWNSLEKFMQSAKGVHNKGCLLIQFPGKITLEYFTQVEEILEKLQQCDPGYEWKKAVEFRHPTWYIGETWELLDQYHASMVLHDIPKSKITTFKGKADFVYVRFHGPKGDYKDSYTEEFLKAKAGEIKEWLSEGKDVYAYFNNTIGNAFENAIALQKMLE